VVDWDDAGAVLVHPANSAVAQSKDTITARRRCLAEFAMVIMFGKRVKNISFLILETKKDLHLIYLLAGDFDI
jgi:hypothetical protein